MESTPRLTSLGHHDVRTILRQLQIRRRVALSIRVAADSRVDIRIGSQNFGDVLQLLLRSKLQMVSAGVKIQPVELEPRFAARLRVGIPNEHE